MKVIDYAFIDEEDKKLKVKKHDGIIEFCNELSDIQLLNLIDYTAFEVYAHDTDIPSGLLTTPHLNYIGKEGDELARAIPASMIETFSIRSQTSQEKQDVIVDWGDGEFIELRNVVPNNLDDGAEFRYTISHTYKNTGTYIIKIFGRNYFGFMTSEDPSTTLLSRIFDEDLPIATWIWNMASAAKNANTLLHVDMYSHLITINGLSWVRAFTNCQNLISVTGFTQYNTNKSNFYKIFNGAINLIKTDLRLSSEGGENNFIEGAFEKCSKLVGDINHLLPLGGFKSGSTINVSNLFRAAKLLSGTVPADKLWNDKSITWINTSTAFEKSSAEIRAQVPVS